MIRFLYDANGKIVEWWWTYPPDENDHRRPLDPIKHPTEVSICRATHSRHPFVCTRLAGHGRRHAASVGQTIIAVWP